MWHLAGAAPQPHGWFSSTLGEAEGWQQAPPLRRARVAGSALADGEAGRQRPCGREGWQAILLKAGSAVADWGKQCRRRPQPARCVQLQRCRQGRRFRLRSLGTGGLQGSLDPDPWHMEKTTAQGR